MITLIFALATVLLAPYAYKKLLQDSCAKAKKNKDFDEAVFNEVHRLFSGFAIDKTRLLLMICFGLTVVGQVLSYLLWNKQIAWVFDFVDYFSLVGIVLVWPVLGLAPWRFGYVLIDKNQVTVPNMWGAVKYPRIGTDVWTYQLGVQTFACCFVYQGSSSLIFVNQQSVKIVEGWVSSD